MSESIKVRHVSKGFDKHTVLHDINLTIEKGKIYGLIGPSGAGKTTLVKLIVGMDHVDEGEIVVLNKKMPHLETLQKIGYMAQADSPERWSGDIRDWSLKDEAWLNPENNQVNKGEDKLTI